MIDSRVREISLFFLYALLDERTAIASAEKTTAILKAKTRASHIDSAQQRVIMIRACMAQLKKARASESRKKPALEMNAVGSLPGHSELTAWHRFYHDATVDELVALLFSRVLKFSDLEIALGLEVSIGTVRHRVGRAVRQLGAISRMTV